MLTKNIQAVTNTRGASLIVTLGLTLVLLLLASGTTKLINTFAKNTSQVERANKAYFAAESGVELALYDLAAYQDGYETDPNTTKSVCGASINLNAANNFNDNCNTGNPYRFANFTGNDTRGEKISGARGFWRLFSRTLVEQGTAQYVIPDPYFVGDKDGILEIDNDSLDTASYASGENEWGTLAKNRPVSLSLMIDDDPSQVDPARRFTYLSDNAEAKVILMLELSDIASWAPNSNGTDPDGAESARDRGDEDLIAWTLSAVDGSGEEYTLQSVIYESDFGDQDCDGDGTNEICFELDLTQSRGVVTPTAGSSDIGNALAGEDINKNIGAGWDACPNDDCVGDLSNPVLNRVSAIKEVFNFNSIPEFIADMNTAKGNSSASSGYAEPWHDVRLTLDMVGTLSETSGTDSNILRYKVVSDEQLADEYTYIVSEGFSALVKQTIETRFLRQSTIPIFSYVIFQ